MVGSLRAAKFVKSGTFPGMRKRPQRLAGTALVWNGLGLEEQLGGELHLPRAVEVAAAGAGGGAKGRETRAGIRHKASPPVEPPGGVTTLHL